MPKRKGYQPRVKVRPPRTPKKPRNALWDLYRDGITYSLLCKFDECPERFRKRVVEGWSESGLQDGMEFGNAFHLCLEKLPRAPEQVTQDYQAVRYANNSVEPHQREDFEKLLAMVEGAVHGHATYWAKDHETMDWVGKEQTFDVPYHIDGKVLRLRGKIDGVYREGRDKNRLWIFESKTKSEIDQEGLHRTLRQDLQTMMYCLAVQHLHQEQVSGILYNVIRRPSIRPRQNESLVEFARRCKDDYLTRPEFYFHRWEVLLDKNDLELWRTRMFDPLIRKLITWWDSIKDNPFEPWKSPHHWQKPFGMYNGLATGRRGSFFDYITSGSHTGLRQLNTVFPELESD